MNLIIKHCTGNPLPVPLKFDTFSGMYLAIFLNISLINACNMYNTNQCDNLFMFLVVFPIYKIKKRSFDSYPAVY